MGGTRNTRLLRRTLVASVVAVVGLVTAAPMAAADPCPLDLGCVLDTTTTTAGGVVDTTTTTTGGVVDDTTTTAGGVVDDTTTTAGGVVDDTTTAVGDTVEGDGPIDPGTVVHGVVPGGLPGNGGVVPGNGDIPPGGGSTPPSGGSTPGGGTPAGPPAAGTHGGPTGVVVGTGSGSIVPAVTGAASTTVGHPFPTFLDGGTGGALFSGAGLARTFAFPLVLILLVIGFVFVQDRIDRKDPKLSLAPVGSDYLTFT